MKAAILCVGDELLGGRILNTNARYLSSFLHGRGWRVAEERTVGDNEEEIAAAVNDLLKKCELLIVTGGLGPTLDDRTVDGVARATGRSVVQSGKMKKRALMRMKYRSALSVTMQSRKVFGAEEIENLAGVAMGQIINIADRRIILLPGVPSEMEWIASNRLADLIESDLKMEYKLRLCCVSEANVQDALIKRLGGGAVGNVAFLPSSGSLLIVSNNKKVVSVAKKEFSENFAGETDAPIERILVETLALKRLTIATAESCTGGLIGALLTSVEGCSRVYKGGMTAYSNDVKAGIQEVDEATLKRYGAISIKTAEEMARNSCMLFNTDASVAVTGIAGPGGGTKAKPVGLVYVTTFYRGKTMTERLEIKGSREIVRQRSAVTAMFKILRRIKDE